MNILPYLYALFIGIYALLIDRVWVRPSKGNNADE